QPDDGGRTSRHQPLLFFSAPIGIYLMIFRTLNECKRTHQKNKASQILSIYKIYSSKTGRLLFLKYL
ncbi:MAG: hypothetical protein WAM26_12700, partial [Nitrososphaeraceae archaeon]